MGETSSKILDIARHPGDWWNLNKACNAASFGINDIKAAVGKAEEHVKYASQAGELLELDASIMFRLRETLEMLRELKERVNQLDSVCKGIAAFTRIKRAIDFLDQPRSIENDPEGAARAFGQLFVGIGHFCKYLGPLKEWSEFFENMGEFFVNVRSGLDPGVRWKRKFDQIEKESGMPMH